MEGTDWILLDTETTGFVRPIYVVEIAAQRMNGWEPIGPPFEKLINQNADIPPEASRVHGYTREILERDGESAENVYEEFRAYTAGLPLVSYNLRYDLDDVLIPEWIRLGIKPIGERGFCALRLAQRLLDPVPAGNCKLQTLRQFYRLPDRGAHTAMGDVDTVADLFESVLKPIAYEKNLSSFDKISAFCKEEWYPSRINFGKYKGYDFRDALNNIELMDWLEWLSQSKNAKTKSMAKWYLAQLLEKSKFSSNKGLTEDLPSDELSDVTDLVPHSQHNISEKSALVEIARARLAALEEEYTKDKRSVDSMQSVIFTLVNDLYKECDRLKLVVFYRSKYLEVLLRNGSDEADRITEQYQKERYSNDSAYEEAERNAQEKAKLTAEEDKQIRILWKKLVRLFHPDRFASQPEKKEVYEKLTAVINAARDKGNIKLLKEIADDPKRYINRQGWQDIDFSDETGLVELERLYSTLQIEIIELIEMIQVLHESPDFELYSIYQTNPTIIDTVVKEQRQQLEKEIEKLKNQADKLSHEIKELDPAGVEGIS